MRVRQTGSKIHRTWQCPASAILPHNTNEDLDAKWEPARGRGQHIHKFLEGMATGKGLEASLLDVPPDLHVLCKALDLGRLPTSLSAEVAFAWNWKTQTARELGRAPDLPRRDDGSVDYDALGVDWSTEIPITVDVCGMREWTPDGSMESVRRGYVGDYKTGHTKYPRPARFGQILLGAVCIRQLWDLQDVIGELLFIDDDGECYPQKDLIDAWTLDIFETELTEVFELDAGREALFLARGQEALDKHEGPHCNHCPAFKDCSTKTALVKAVPDQLIRLGAKRDRSGELELVWVPKEGGKPDEGAWELDLVPGAITVRNAAAVYEACERVEALCRRMREEVCGIAYHEPIALSDGRVIERYQWKKREVVGPVAVSVLESLYGREAVLKKVDIKLPLSAIEDLVRENTDWTKKPRPVMSSKKGTGELDKVLSRIEKAHGLNVNVGEDCKPHKVRGAAKNGD